MNGASAIRAAGRRMFAVVLIAAMTAVPAFAQQSEYEEGRLQGEQDARGRPVWFLSGLFLGPVGLILPWVINPKVPGANLVGRSADYVDGYTEGYRDTAKPKNFYYSLAGCAVWGVVATLTVVGAQLAAETAASGLGAACSDIGKGLGESCSPSCSPSTPSCSPSPGSSPLFSRLSGGLSRE